MDLLCKLYWYTLGIIKVIMQFSMPFISAATLMETKDVIKLVYCAVISTATLNALI